MCEGVGRENGIKIVRGRISNIKKLLVEVGLILASEKILQGKNLNSTRIHNVLP